MFALARKTLAGRSNWAPPFSLKSASKTTFSHGPGQFPGGVTAKLWVESEKCANWKFTKSGTTQGCRSGLGTSGSAVTVNCVPICRFVLCARTVAVGISDAARRAINGSFCNQRRLGFIQTPYRFGYLGDRGLQIRDSLIASLSGICQEFIDRIDTYRSLFCSRSNIMPRLVSNQRQRTCRPKAKTGSRRVASYPVVGHRQP